MINLDNRRVVLAVAIGLYAIAQTIACKLLGMGDGPTQTLVLGAIGALIPAAFVAEGYMGRQQRLDPSTLAEQIAASGGAGRDLAAGGGPVHPFGGGGDDPPPGPKGP